MHVVEGPGTGVRKGRGCDLSQPRTRGLVMCIVVGNILSRVFVPFHVCLCRLTDALSVPAALDPCNVPLDSPRASSCDVFRRRTQHIPLSATAAPPAAAVVFSLSHFPQALQGVREDELVQYGMKKGHARFVVTSLAAGFGL